MAHSEGPFNVNYLLTPTPPFLPSSSSLVKISKRQRRRKCILHDRRNLMAGQTKESNLWKLFGESNLSGRGGRGKVLMMGTEEKGSLSVPPLHFSPATKDQKLFSKFSSECS